MPKIYHFNRISNTRRTTTEPLPPAGSRAHDSERPCNKLRHFRVLEHSRVLRDAQRNVFGPRPRESLHHQALVTCYPRLPQAVAKFSSLRFHWSLHPFPALQHSSHTTTTRRSGMSNPPHNTIRHVPLTSLLRIWPSSTGPRAPVTYLPGPWAQPPA
jgi:hypothetical protein